MKITTMSRWLVTSSLFVTFISCGKDMQEKKMDTAVATGNTATVTMLASNVLWDGDANLGTGVFKILNLEDGAVLDAVNNTTYGKIWRFYKPVGSNRSEVHAAQGFQAAEGDDIYLGWRSQLSMPSTVTTNAFFQWKAYGSNMTQNFPIVIKAVSGNLKLFHFAPGQIGTELWSTPLSVNSWNRFVVRIKVSRTASVGFIEFWYNGVQQTLTGGSQRYYGRTLDADYCDPKWGVYGASTTEIYNRIHALKIATTYADAAP